MINSLLWSGIPGEASQYTWIFTSILSSEMLLKIEQLLTRTKVVSIFATQNKALLHSAVKVKDNAAKISAMETSLPYLYMLRQLYLAYLEAWLDLCDGRRGKCERLAALQPSQFIQTYFNPSIKARRKTPISFMLIVYRSSAVEDYLDLEIPIEREDLTSTSTVSAVMSTMQEEAGTIVPTVVITQTVSTINLTEQSSTTRSTTRPSSQAAAVTTQQPASTSTESGQERCRKYNACVVYLLQDNEVSQEIEDILAVGTGANRRSGLSVGTATVSLDQMYDVTLPRNTIATVTIQEKGEQVLVPLSQSEPESRVGWLVVSNNCFHIN